MAKCFKIFLLLIFLPVFLFAQNDNPSINSGQSIRFERLSLEQGLSHDKVRCIIQDSQGFMWLGSEDGLNKYDGYKFKVYGHDPDDSTSIGSNYINDLFIDHSGTLWIGTFKGGLNKFDREKESFIRYKYEQNKTSSIKSNTVTQICEFRYKEKDILWVGTDLGLHKMDLATRQFKHLPHTNRKYPYTYIEALLVDSAGIVWFGTSEGGLHKFHPETEQYTHYQHDPDNPSSLSNDRVMALYLDKFNILWIGTTDSRLNKFDIEKKQFSSYHMPYGDGRNKRGHFALKILEDHAGKLWIGTGIRGLNIFNRETERFTLYPNDPGDQMSISDNTVLDIYRDQSGVMWLGTWGGLNKSDPGKSQFTFYKNIPGDPNSLTSNFVGQVLESNFGGKKSLWISTREGLNKIDRESGNCTRYVNDPKDAGSIPSNLGISMFEDRNGILWIGTKGDGLIKFDQKTEQFTHYFERKDPFNIIRSIYEDNQGILWLSTRVGGLVQFDREDESFKGMTDPMFATQVIEDKSGSLWVATFRGLKKFIHETGTFVTYEHEPDNPHSLSNNNVLAICVSHIDEIEVLWVGTQGGLNKFNPKLGTFEHFTVEDGLPNNIINSILEDDKGNLWLGTSDGLSKFNPENETFKNYDDDDGLPGTLHWLCGCFKNDEGEMFFGTTKGAYSFFPDRLVDNLHIPKIVLTDFQIFNEPIAIKKNASEKNNIFTLPKHISLMEEIEISYKENIFSFEFAALDYFSPQKNQYAYKMEGVDPDWVYTDASRRFATYTNLDPGEYVFRVKGSNNDGLWNEEGTSINIIITPPWWRTNLAYTFYILLFGYIIFTTWRVQLRRIHIKQQLKMEHFEAEKLRDVDKLKNRFFANISHEFRTPLTLILGPIEQMISGKLKGNLIEQYQMIRRNGKRLLQLINQLLDLSKLESGGMKLKVSETDIVKYLKGSVLSFSSLAERKKISLKLNITNKNIYGYVDHDKLEKIVTNLLSNAFKFTPEGGLVEVTVLLTPLPSASPLSKEGTRGVKITISNTGLGIPADQLDKIFNRFYQADDNYKKDSEGSGIGLALIKELVEVCHGEISVSSIPNKTTSFIVTLPIAKEYFKEDEIIEEKETADRIPEDGKQNPNEEENILVQPEFEKRSPASSLHSPLLLIVEDNPDVTAYICSFMENDYRLITAKNGNIGLKKTLDKYPDLIISDVMMPEMDGFELCEKIKTDERISHIPVILLTAKADLNSKIEGLEFGADDYINKPFEADELKVRTKNLINQRRKLREKFSQLIDLKPEDISASSMDEQLLQRLLSVFEDHMEESDFTLEHLAKEIGMSRTHLSRKIQAIANLSTQDFIRTLRLQRAARLLSNTTGTISEIAYKVGFNNLSYFSRAFRKHFGKLPSEYPSKK